MTLPVLSCSIVLYNNDMDMLGKAIASVLQSAQIHRLYLIDHSPAPLFTDAFDDPRVVYQFMDANKGYGAGHNVALRKSLSEQIPFHLVLNPDVYFAEDTLTQLLSYAEKHPETGNIMPLVRYPDGSLQYLCKLLPTPYDWIGRRFNPFRSMTERRNHVFELRFTGYKEVMNVPYLSGCFMLLRTEAIAKTGLFDERIFMYGEETDLCRRLIAAGYQTIFYPKATIYHAFAKGSHRSLRLTWIGIRSAIYYFNKWGWLFDKERQKINATTLSRLGYRS